MIFTHTDKLLELPSVLESLKDYLYKLFVRYIDSMACAVLCRVKDAVTTTLLASFVKTHKRLKYDRILLGRRCHHYPIIDSLGKTRKRLNYR